MDPFNEVKEDAWLTISNLETIISKKRKNLTNTDLNDDFKNNFQELEEIYLDLEQATTVSEKQPDKFGLSSSDVLNRKKILKTINEKIKSITREWDHIRQKPITTMSNRISQESISENPFESVNQFQQQEMIQEQDVQLDSIHDTMRNLNQQAAMMGNELEEQGFMLDELDEEIDNLDNKLTRGVKRINTFIERNRERGSDWCIGILAVALCILLILVIAI